MTCPVGSGRIRERGGIGMNETDAKIVLALAQCSMNIREVAVKLNYHRNTVVYHVEKIRKITGLNPRNFFDLGELLTIAREVLGNDYEL